MKSQSNAKLFSKALVVLSAITLTLFLSSMAKAYEELVDRQAGIRISALPISLSRGHQVRIRVWIDFHTEEQNKNALETSILVDDQGKEYHPLSLRWFQSSTGRYKGDLLFPKIGDHIKTIKLIIKGAAGAKMRVFKWSLI